MSQYRYTYRNPVRMPDGCINCQVKFELPANLAALGWLEYNADPADPDPRAIGRDLHRTALADPRLRDFQEDPEITIDRARAAVRSERDERLRQTDWTQLPDVPPETKALWVPYRQSLRNVPSQEGFPLRITWPVPPVGA